MMNDEDMQLINHLKLYTLDYVNKIQDYADRHNIDQAKLDEAFKEVTFKYTNLYQYKCCCRKDDMAVLKHICKDFIDECLKLAYSKKTELDTVLTVAISMLQVLSSARVKELNKRTDDGCGLQI